MTNLPDTCIPVVFQLLFLLCVQSVSVFAVGTDDIQNPYYSGCLREKLSNSEYSNSSFSRQLRICNSADTPDAIGHYCRLPDFADSYMEIRVNAGNWDSPIIAAWLIQIILSEILGVPTSIEAGSYGESRNFYDPQATIDYSTSSYVDFLAAPSNYEGGDCNLAARNSVEDYEPCAHFNPEHWHVEHANVTRNLQAQGIEPPQNSGSLGHETWFVTKFTAEQDPTVVSYLGLKGEQNRQKLAETFKRPTTWQEYCQQVSTTNCTVPDEVASRPPQDDSSEGNQYYKEGEFTGYFRATELNDCDANPKECTGHIANYVCEWPSYMETQLFHLNIPLKLEHYSYSRAVEMWNAANATRSNLIMMWWTPEPLYQKYLGSDAELIQVVLPPQTQDCVNARPSDECSDTLVDRVGPPEAACAQAPRPLVKMISNVLQEKEISTTIPDAIKSPAYQMLQSFMLREVQLNELFGLWSTAESPRDAVCQWAADHLEDFLLVHVPSTYPRIPQVQTNTSDSNSVLNYVTMAVAIFATLAVLVTCLAVKSQQNRKASLRYAQVEFLWFLLAGSLMITVGSIISSVPAPSISNGICIASIWLINVGYNFELVPLIVKVAAINRLMSSAERMRRITLPRQQLYGTVAIITILCIVFLILWTTLDAPQKDSEYTLLTDQTNGGEHIVAVTYYCQDGTSYGWKLAAVGWNVVLLLCASVLAFQTRGTIQTFNESRTLGILIYSHFVFVILRCATYFLDDHLQGTTLNHVRCLLYSVDTLATVVIYFVPKLLAKDDSHIMSSQFMVSGHNINSSSPLNGSSPFTNSNGISKPLVAAKGGSAPLTNSGSMGTGSQNNSSPFKVVGEVTKPPEPEEAVQDVPAF